MNSGHQKRSRVAVVSGAAASFLLFAPFAARAQVTVTKIADSASPILDDFFFAQNPQIGANGTVAFQASRDAAAGGGSGIYAGSGGAVATVADTTSGVFSGFNGFAIGSGATVVYVGNRGAFAGYGLYSGNGSAAQVTLADLSTATPFASIGALRVNGGDRVAFTGNRANFVGGVYTIAASGGSLTTIAETSSPIFSTFSGNVPSINGSGRVGFQAGRDAGGAGLYTGSGGATTTITESPGSPFFVYEDPPEITGSGSLVFRATLRAGGDGIYAGSGGAITTLADSSSPVFSSFGRPVVNDGGTVAFRAQRDAGGYGVYSVSSAGGAITTIADSTMPAFTGYVFTSGIGINTSGTIAFQGTRITGSFLDGIYASLAGSASPIALVQTGDLLFGSTVTELRLAVSGFLNDNNQVAFGYTLASGVTGIARVDIARTVTTSAPEPGSAVLACLGGILGLLRAGRVGRRRVR